jgi:hypothetical protein
MLKQTQFKRKKHLIFLHDAFVSLKIRAVQVFLNWYATRFGICSHGKATELV